MFEVGWCVTLYTTVLFLEFCRWCWRSSACTSRCDGCAAISVPLMIAGVILSTLHQSFAGHALPDRAEQAASAVVLAAPAGAVLRLGDLRGAGDDDLRILAFRAGPSAARWNCRCWRAWRACWRCCCRFICGCGFWTCRTAGALPLLRENRDRNLAVRRSKSSLMLVPMLLLFRGHVRQRPGALYACAVMVVFGFIANRLNVSITGMEAGSGVHYIPKWTRGRGYAGDRRAGLCDLPVRRPVLPDFRGARRSAGAAARASKCRWREIAQ